MRLKILGTRGEVEEKSRTHLNQTGLLISWRNYRILFDVGEKKFLRTKPHWIFLTHCHPDHTKGLEDKAPRIPIYVHKASTKIEKPGKWFQPFIQFTKPILWKGMLLEAVPCYHSITCPSVGFKFSAGGITIGFFPCLLKPKVSIKEAFSDIDLLLGDTSFLRRPMVRRTKEGRRIGHTCAYQMLRWCDLVGIRNYIAIHFGTIPIRMGDDRLEKLLNKYKDKINPKIKVTLGKDGMSIRLRRKEL